MWRVGIGLEDAADVPPFKEDVVAFRLIGVGIVRSPQCGLLDATTLGHFDAEWAPSTASRHHRMSAPFIREGILVH